MLRDEEALAQKMIILLITLPGTLGRLLYILLNILVWLRPCRQSVFGCLLMCWRIVLLVCNYWGGSVLAVLCDDICQYVGSLKCSFSPHRLRYVSSLTLPLSDGVSLRETTKAGEEACPQTKQTHPANKLNYEVAPSILQLHVTAKCP